MDDEQAIRQVGAFINATLRDHRFPEPGTGVDSHPNLALFTPYHLTPADFASLFTVTDLSTGSGDTPCQLKAHFRNGKTVQFCALAFVYNTATVSASACPEHPDPASWSRP